VTAVPLRFRRGGRCKSEDQREKKEGKRKIEPELAPGKRKERDFIIAEGGGGKKKKKDGKKAQSRSRLFVAPEKGKKKKELRKKKKEALHQEGNLHF